MKQTVMQDVRVYSAKRHSSLRHLRTCWNFLAIARQKHLSKQLGQGSSKPSARLPMLQRLQNSDVSSIIQQLLPALIHIYHLGINK